MKLYKKYADGFGKSQKRIKDIDAMQDKNFRDQLRFGILEKVGIYLNLGTYWTEKYKKKREEIRSYIEINKSIKR